MYRKVPQEVDEVSPVWGTEQSAPLRSLASLRTDCCDIRLDVGPGDTRRQRDACRGRGRDGRRNLVDGGHRRGAQVGRAGRGLGNRDPATSRCGDLDVVPSGRREADGAVLEFGGQRAADGRADTQIAVPVVGGEERGLCSGDAVEVTLRVEVVRVRDEPEN